MSASDAVEGLSEPQRTVSGPARATGVGLFTGAPATATILPAAPGAGVRFRRTDVEGAPEIPASVEHVEEAARRSVLRVGEASVQTTEHCLGALAGLGIDNAVVELDGPELPAGDGSAGFFVEAIQAAGVEEQDEPRDPIVVTQPIAVRRGDSTLAILPCDRPTLELTYLLDYGEGSPIARQTHSFSLDDGTFATRVAPARTFSTAEEAEGARRMGLFGHLTPKDMLVIGDSGPIDNAYRFEDEPVRHKLLDLLGDLSLVGRPVHGRVVAYRSGHALNHQLARAILEAEARPGEVVAEGASPAMDIRDILRVLPHRYPMVLVDRVIEIDGHSRAVGVKNVSINEPFFQGHYPGSPIMPGVLIVEAMCQLAGLMLGRRLDREGKVAVLLSMDDVRLRSAVTPGDQLVMETEAIRSGSRYGDVDCRAFVAGRLVAEARVKFMMADPEKAR